MPSSAMSQRRPRTSRGNGKRGQARLSAAPTEILLRRCASCRRSAHAHPDDDSLCCICRPIRRTGSVTVRKACSRRNPFLGHAHGNDGHVWKRFPASSADRTMLSIAGVTLIGLRSGSPASAGKRFPAIDLDSAWPNSTDLHEYKTADKTKTVRSDPRVRMEAPRINRTVSIVAEGGGRILRPHASFHHTQRSCSWRSQGLQGGLSLEASAIQVR